MACRQGAWGHVEHVDDPHLTARRTLSLVGERMGRRVQGRVAVPPSLPLGIERAVSVRSGSSGSASGTFGGEWQCDSHCHSASSVLGGAPYTATRHRACRIGTFRGEWQCNQYARERAAARRTLPLGGERTGQCVPHCHSASSVLYRYDQGRVAVLAGTNSKPAAVMPIGEWPNWANALGQPPAKPQGGCARVGRPRPGA